MAKENANPVPSPPPATPPAAAGPPQAGEIVTQTVVDPRTGEKRRIRVKILGVGVPPQE